MLYQWGFRSADQLAEANENNFEVEGISPERARQVIHAAREWIVTRKRIEEEKAALAIAIAAEAAQAPPDEPVEAALEGAPEAPADNEPHEPAPDVASNVEAKS